MRPSDNKHKHYACLLILFVFIAFSSCKKNTAKTDTAKKETPTQPAPPANPDPPAVEPTATEPPQTETSQPEPPAPKPPQPEAKVYNGTATYYHDKFQGRPTASGELYDKNLYTAAIRTNAMDIPLGSTVEVYSEKRKKRVRVKVNDKMSPRTSAIVDLSYIAAEAIGLHLDGRTKVTVKKVEDGTAGKVEE